jgi:large subunit ribosomal protein L10
MYSAVDAEFFCQKIMKTKVQKQSEIKRGAELLDKSSALVFADFTKVATEDVRKLRRELQKDGSKFLVIKKRLLNVILKEKGIDFDVRRFKLSVGTVFAQSGIEEVSAPVVKFFKAMKLEKEKVLGGYDIKKKAFVEAGDVIMIGQLPSREVLLSQLVGQLAAPLTSLLYVLSERSKKVATE